MFRSMRSWELSGLIGRVGVMFRMCGIGLEYVSVGDIGMNGCGMTVFSLKRVRVLDDVGRGIQIGRGPGFRRYWAWKSDRSS